MRKVKYMAQIDIRNLIRVNKERNTIHDQAYATYTVFDNNGEKYLQIDTYGKPARENPGRLVNLSNLIEK